MDEDDFDPLVYLINMGFDAGTASRKGYILNSIIYEQLYAFEKNLNGYQKRVNILARSCTFTPVTLEFNAKLFLIVRQGTLDNNLICFILKKPIIPNSTLFATNHNLNQALDMLLRFE